MTRWRVRAATEADVGAIDALVRALAVYEREPHAVEGSADDLAVALFGPDPRLHAHVAEVDGEDGPTVAGVALWFVSYSTWRGRHGIWLEDLFVQPAHRGLGLGRALLQELASVCAEQGWTRLEWSVLDWNESAQGFYRSLGAAPQDAWTTWRLDGGALAALGDPPRAEQAHER